MLNALRVSWRLTLRRNADEPMQATLHVQIDAGHSRDVQRRLINLDVFERFEIARTLAVPETIWARPFGAHLFPARGRLIMGGDVAEIVLFEDDSVSGVERLLCVTQFSNHITRVRAQSFGRLVERRHAIDNPVLRKPTGKRQQNQERDNSPDEQPGIRLHQRIIH